MRSARPLITLGLILAALIAVAIGVRLFGRPAPKNVNPLEAVDPAKIVKMIIANSAGKFTLERTVNGPWRVTQPVADAAADDLIEQITDSLSQFSVGSAVSENDKHYDQFELTPGADARVQVYLQGKEKPILDLHVGKVSASYDSCYVRFEGHKEVRIGHHIMPFLFRKSADEFRLKRIFPKDIASATGLSFQDSKGTFRISKSSPSWVNEAGAQVSSATVASLINFLSGWTAVGFASSPLEATQNGLGSPTLTVTATTSGGTYSVSLGDKVPKAPSAATADERYAKVEGRDAVLRVGDNIYNGIISNLKKLH